MTPLDVIFRTIRDFNKRAPEAATSFQQDALDRELAQAIDGSLAAFGYAFVVAPIPPV